MTATKSSTKSNASDTVNPEVLDADAVTSVDRPSDDAGNTEAPAEAPKDDNTKAPAEAPKTKLDPEKVVADVKEAVEWARQREAVDNARNDAAKTLQANAHYHDIGCFYGSATPVANALGAEIGVVTKDEKTNKVQRTGVGLYIRSDHMADVKYDCSDF